MQEQQGNLEEPLSGLPGPRPFNKNNKKGVPMEDNKKLDDIVTKATEALASGKAFGGWTDKVEEQVVKQGKPIPMKLGKGEPAGRSREEHQKKVDKGRIRQGNWKDSVEHEIPVIKVNYSEPPQGTVKVAEGLESGKMKPKTKFPNSGPPGTSNPSKPPFLS